MTLSVHNAVQAMLQAITVENKLDADGGAHRPVVAISSDHGAGGSVIGALLAERLGAQYYDRLILEKIAERLRTDVESLQGIDSGVGKARDLWLYRMVTGIDISPGTYRRHLVNVILGLAKVGGVISGRGAHVVLSTSAALRVRITGSLDVCAERYAAARGVEIEVAIKRVKEVNHNRGKFLWDMFQTRLNDPTTYDLVINTDRFTDAEDVVDILADACRSVGGAKENCRVIRDRIAIGR